MLRSLLGLQADALLAQSDDDAADPGVVVTARHVDLAYAGARFHLPRLTKAGQPVDG